MRRKVDPLYIQPDSRGRIQLPKELRKYRLFKFDEDHGRYALTPLEVVEKLERPSANAVWLTPEVNLFLAETIFPKLSAYLAKSSDPNLVAAFLYGSRARGDALSHSDFDVGLLVARYPGFGQRHETMDALQELLSPEIKRLANHGVEAELSLQFFSTEIDPENLPPIYYSLATDAKLIWQLGRKGDAFVKNVRHAMKTKKVVAVDTGKKRRWKWEVT